MNAIPSLIAGNKNVSLFTPTKNDEPINPCILFAASLCNIKNIYRVGGVQAIGMMGFGNEQFNKVDKIFGPGNMYVAEAKKQILSTFGECNIDMPAGPSEVLVVADEFADADFVASDLLAQLEHDIEAKGILITINDNFVNKVIKSIEKQKINLSRKQIIKTAMVKNLIFITTNSLENAIKISNKFSPEHLIIQTNKNKELTALVQNAGSVFIGKYSSEALGDYISGTNHVLPTSG
ncbi:hypothetical protein FACS189459_3420 [Bacilli bacterium]|nr:hypothetical protein FACS189459_3420 [Bacilli bacterium]